LARAFAWGFPRQEGGANVIENWERKPQKKSAEEHHAVGGGRRIMLLTINKRGEEEDSRVGKN